MHVVALMLIFFFSFSVILKNELGFSVLRQKDMKSLRNVKEGVFVESPLVFWPPFEEVRDLKMSF